MKTYSIIWHHSTRPKIIIISKQFIKISPINRQRTANCEYSWSKVVKRALHRHLSRETVTSQQHFCNKTNSTGKLNFVNVPRTLVFVPVYCLVCILAIICLVWCCCCYWSRIIRASCQLRERVLDIAC